MNNERFKIRKEGEEEPVCLLCSSPLFKESSVGCFCMTCDPVVHVCSSCKDIFLESHSDDHVIGQIFNSKKDFIENYRKDIQETCDELIEDDEYNQCIQFCQTAMSMNISTEISVFCLRMGMVCHVHLLEYSEAKNLGKLAIQFIDKENLELSVDEVEIISKLCHIYLKLENPKKCLSYGERILFKKNIGKKEVPQDTLDDIKFSCGKASIELEKYDDAIRYLDEVLLKNCKNKNFTKARFSLSSLLETYLLTNDRKKGIEKYNEIKKNFPSILEKDTHMDVSFVRLKKSLGKIRDIVDSSSFDLSNSLDGKLIEFNKQHFNAIIDNNTSTDYNKLVRSIELGEELIIECLREKQSLIEKDENFKRVDQKLENVVKKRAQLIERIYVCCLLKDEKEEAFQWAERGKSFLMFARNLISNNDSLSDEEKTKLLGERINIDELMELGRTNNVIFINFVIINEYHYGEGDFVDVWVIHPHKKHEMIPNEKGEIPIHMQEFVRIRLTHKPLELVKLILEIYTEVNQVNSFFLDRIEKQNFKNHISEIKRWQIFVDKIFSGNQKKFQRYNEILEELYTYLFIPIQMFLPKEEKLTSRIRKTNTGDFDEFENFEKGYFDQDDLSLQKQKRARSLDPSNNALPSEPTTKYMVIIPDDFFFFIPFSFLKRSKKQFLIDHYNVSISHSLKLFYYNIWQLKNGRNLRAESLSEKLKFNLLPNSPKTTSSRMRRKSRKRSLVMTMEERGKIELLRSPLSTPTKEGKESNVNSPLVVKNVINGGNIPSPMHSPQGIRKGYDDDDDDGKEIKSQEDQTTLMISSLLGGESPKLISNQNFERESKAFKESIFGFILTDSFDEFRKTELLPIYQIFQRVLREPKSSVLKYYCDNIIFPPTSHIKEKLDKLFNEFYDIDLGPKVLHIANRSSCSGKNLPTFQKEMNPMHGLKLCVIEIDESSGGVRKRKKKSEVLSCDELEILLDLQGTELVVFSHNASIYTNNTFDGLNGIHRSIMHLGCPTILYPLFDVSEFFSTLFLIQFYKHILGTDIQTKKTKAEAYRHAMISSMEIFPLLRKYPMFLSSFQILGEALNKVQETDNLDETILRKLVKQREMKNSKRVF